MTDKSNRDDTRTYKSSFVGFLNSNFSITILGGLLLWGISAYWQYTVDKHKESQRKQEIVYERKLSVIEMIASKFIYSLSLLQEYKTREAWLILNKEQIDEARYYDGRTFRETVEKYEASLNIYQQLPTIFSYKASIKALFSDCTFSPHLENISVKLEEIVSSQSDLVRKTLNQRIPEIEADYEILLENMIRETTGVKVPCDINKSN